VKIPAGIDDGMRIRSAGNGEPGINGGPPGDLYVEIHIKPHAVFERDGDDLHCQMPIRSRPPRSAARSRCRRWPAARRSGAGRHAVRQDVPPARQGHQGLRSSIAGDLYVHVQVETPVKLTDQQRDLLKQFEKSLAEGGARHSPQSKSWFDRMKSFFE
jgi:molecular chaperone DnaJ